MAKPENYPGDECINVYWKIKKFNYCSDSILSPEFILNNFLCHLKLYQDCAEIVCRIERADFYPINTSTEMQISFLTADSSEEESVSGNELRVSKDVIFRNRRSAFLPEDTLTVRFRSPTSSEKGSFFMCSQTGVKRKYLLLDINIYDQHDIQYRKCIENSKLYGRIKLNLNSSCGFDSAEQFNIEISKEGGEKCFCFLKVSVLDVDGNALNEVSDNFIFAKQVSQQTRGFPSIIKKSKWLECKSQLLSEDTLSLKCYLVLSLRTLPNETSIVSYCDNSKPLMKESEDLLVTFIGKNETASATELQAELKSMLDAGILYDVSLQIDTEFIQAHKVILSARSPVFKAMFTKDMKENINSIVVIKDFDMDTMRRLLLYMYTDTILDENWESIKKLYVAADKYGILSLKKKCVSILKTNLSVSNVCEAAYLADLHQDDDFKTATLDFIYEHDFAVFASDTWKEFENNNSSSAFRIVHEIHRNTRMRLA